MIARDTDVNYSRGGLTWTAFVCLVIAHSITVARCDDQSHEQSGQSKGTAAILPDAALLIHGPAGEYSYKLTGTADDSVTLEEFGDRRMRLEIRQIPARNVSLPLQASKGMGSM
jgi:hypothetical protein